MQLVIIGQTNINITVELLLQFLIIFVYVLLFIFFVQPQQCYSTPNGTKKFYIMYKVFIIYKCIGSAKEVPRNCRGSAKEVQRKCQGSAKEVLRKCQQPTATATDFHLLTPPLGAVGGGVNPISFWMFLHFKKKYKLCDRRSILALRPSTRSLQDTRK